MVGEGIGARGGNWNTTTGLYEPYGEERLRDTPITERGFTSLCTGAAATGPRPVVDFMFIDFLADAFGDMLNQMAKLQWMSGGRLKMPILVRGCVGVAPNAAHHSGNYYPFFMHIPGFRVVMPTTPADAKGLIKTALRTDDPVLFLEHKNLLGLKGPVPEGEYSCRSARPRSRARRAMMSTVVGIGWTVRLALEAAEQLGPRGLSVEVIDPRTLAPLDMETILASVHKTGRLLVVDEDFAPCGVGAEIATQVMERVRRPGCAVPRRERRLLSRRPTAPPLSEAVVPNVQHRAGHARPAGRVRPGR